MSADKRLLTVFFALGFYVFLCYAKVNTDDKYRLTKARTNGISRLPATYEDSREKVYLRGSIETRVIDDSTQVVPTAKIIVDRLRPLYKRMTKAHFLNPREYYSHHLATVLAESSVESKYADFFNRDDFFPSSKTKKKRRKKRRKSKKTKKNKEAVDFTNVYLRDQQPADRLQRGIQLRPKYPSGVKPKVITLHSPTKIYIPIWEDDTDDLYDAQTCVRCPVRMTLMPNRLQESVMLPVPPISICSRLARQKGKLNLGIVSGPRPGDILSQGNYPITLIAWKVITQISSCNFTVFVEVRKCPELKIPSGVRMNCTSGATWGSLCNFTCTNVHHVLQGSPLASCEEDSSGEVTWYNFVQPICKPDFRELSRDLDEPKQPVVTSCPTLPFPVHGTIVCSTEADKGRYLEGTMCQYICYPGYTMSLPVSQVQSPFACSAGVWTPLLNVTCKARVTSKPVTTPRIKRIRTTKRPRLRVNTKKPSLPTKTTPKTPETSPFVTTSSTTSSTETVTSPDILNVTTDQVLSENTTTGIEVTSPTIESNVNSTFPSLTDNDTSAWSTTSYEQTTMTTTQDSTTRIIQLETTLSTKHDNALEERDEYHSRNGNSDVPPDIGSNEFDIPDWILKAINEEYDSSTTTVSTTTQGRMSLTSLEVTLSFSTEVDVENCLEVDAIGDIQESLKKALLDINKDTCTNYVNCSGLFVFECTEDLTNVLLTKWTFSAPFDVPEYESNNNVPSAETHLESVISRTYQEIKLGFPNYQIPGIEFQSNTFTKTPMRVICNERGFFVNKYHKCVQCPINTAEIEGECQPCPKNQYQDQVGQTECKEWWSNVPLS